MTGAPVRVRLSRSQQNIYNGVLQDADPTLYLIGKRYRFHPRPLGEFLHALQATIATHPAQLCVLSPPPTEGRYPDLLPQLSFDEIVRVHEDESALAGHGGNELARCWSSGILTQPLVRYTVRTDAHGKVSGLDVHAHHILLDGGATGVIEADLARHLTAPEPSGIPSLDAGLTKLAAAHRRETERADDAAQRLSANVQRELTAATQHHGADETPVTAARGVLHESTTISGRNFEAIAALAEAKEVPLNILVAAAAVAVEASLRQSTDGVLIHAVDNRFGEPDLDVASCLVNSVAHPVRFPAFASVHDVVRTLDHDYVRAARRRWLREEQYRRMYLAINRTAHLQALTFNFIRQSCAPDLLPLLSEPPVATHIGPVEGMTVACVLDEDQRTLSLSIWNRADVPADKRHPWVAERIAAALGSMSALWHQPIAMAVNEWFGTDTDGARCCGELPTGAAEPAVPAWFLHPAARTHRYLEERRHIYPWVAWLVHSGAEPGDIVVLADDDTDKTVDLLIACHLIGCGYSVCGSAEQIPLRLSMIAEHCDGVAVRTVDVAGTALTPGPEGRRLAGERLARLAADDGLADRLAYVMATSGSTGEPKLVPITHGSLALFCAAGADAYGWGAEDIVLQCAPLTSDISVEEVFVAAFCGSRLTRTASMKTGDLEALSRDLVAAEPTVVDLPTAIWHLLCEDRQALTALAGTRLRQVIIGGEAVRPGAADKWFESPAGQDISLVSSYGPTEATVVASYLPIEPGSALSRLGRPMVPNSVFIAFGEVIILGSTVSPGYLGTGSIDFGKVRGADGSQYLAFATADRVSFDDNGFPVIGGRRDAIVKVSGKRVDLAEIGRRICEIPGVCDMGAEVHDGALAVWFQTQRTRQGDDDADAATRIRRVLASLAVSSFFTIGVPAIPRKPNGKIDSAALRALPQFAAAAPDGTAQEEHAAGLAQIWSRHLGRVIRPGSSLLDEGVGSLDLIKLLPDTREHLGRRVTVLDLISADTAVNLVNAVPSHDRLIDASTIAQIAEDVAVLPARRGDEALSSKTFRPRRGTGAIVVLGASGILGTGFTQAALDLTRSRALSCEVVLATRSSLPERDPWTDLCDAGAVRIRHVPCDLDPDALDVLIDQTGARIVVNCIGNTNMLMPYHSLRPANIEVVYALSRVCARRGARLIHSSTYVVNADITAPSVTDPRDAMYPYAASKSLAELIVAAEPGLEFTLVRLPRVLGTKAQTHGSNDILVAVTDACLALGAYPAVALTEQVTTGRAAAAQILGRVGDGRAAHPREITVVRGATVNYAEFLGGFRLPELDIAEWKHRLDDSDWAGANPRRWSVVDAWATLGATLGGRSYSESLAERARVHLDVDFVGETVSGPEDIGDLVRSGLTWGLNRTR